MILRIPDYYRQFQCIASECKDSCCIGWEIDIDEDTCGYYQSVEGKFGERLTEYMEEDEEGTVHFSLQRNGWCPFLNEKKLCEICIELGEEALSEVCTEYPRFTVSYENVTEKALSLSCEEVGRILFSKKEQTTFEEIVLEGEQQEWDESEFAGERRKLEKIRQGAFEILFDRSRSIRERIRQYLLYCAKEQGIELQQSRQASEEEAQKLFQERMKCLSEMEILDAGWTEETAGMEAYFQNHPYLKRTEEFLNAREENEVEYEQLIVYFTFRYFMKSYYDGNFLGKAQFAVLSYLTIRDMDTVCYQKKGGCYTLEDRIANVKKYAKEVEHSEMNLELLEESFLFENCMSVASLWKVI